MGENIAFIAATECVVGLSLLIPWIIKFLIDIVLTEGHWDAFPVFVIGIAAAVLVSRLLSIATNILYGKFSANIEARARDNLFAYILKKDLSFFNTTEDGEIVDRLINTPEQLHTVPSIYLERFLTSIGTILVVFVILLSIHPIMALASAIAIPIFVVIYLKTRALFFSQIQAAREETAKLTEFYMATIRNIAQVKNLCSEAQEQRASAARNDRIKQLCLKFAVSGAFVSNGVQIVTQLNQLGVLIYGAILVHNGQMTIGTLVAFYSYLELLYQPIISMIQTFNDINHSLVGMERYLEFFTHDHEEEPTAHREQPLPLRTDIDFSEVCFSYGEKQVLQDVSFHIGSSEKVLIRGKSGIGKSTIAALIKRFYPCDSGQISVGDLDITQYPLQSLRKQIAYLPQENYFFPFSIRENFRRVDPSITDAKIEQLLQSVSLYADVFGPGKMGLDTSLEKNGILFSGGQRRRMSIAMLLASDAPIFVLDEPFTGLDKETERNIWPHIRDALQEKTVLLIDHNFSDDQFFQQKWEISPTGITALPAENTAASAGSACK